MRRLFIVWTLALTLALPAFARAEVVERIVAVVNDEIVTEQDLQYAMAPVLAQYRAVYSGPELEEKLIKARRDFLSKVIEDKLILSEAKRLKVVVEDKEVDQMIADVHNKFPSKELFVKALEDQGMTEKKLWARFRDQIMTQKLVAYEVRSRINVTPAEVSEYYKNHTGEFVLGDKVKLSQILVRTGTRTDEEALTLARSLIEKINAGSSFEEVAKSSSEGAEAADGGLMGWIEKGQLMGEIEGQVFALEPGVVSEPVKSALGYHIFRVIEKVNSSLKDFSEVKSAISDKLTKDKIKVRLDQWLGDLKKNAYISVR